MPCELSPRKRIIGTLKRQKPDKVPKDLWWTYQIGKLIQEKTGSSDPLEHFGCEQRLIRWSETKKRRDFSAYLGESSSSWIDKNLLKEENLTKGEVPSLGGEQGGGEWGTGKPPSSPWIDQEWGVGYIPNASKDPLHAHLFGFLHPMRNLRTIEELKEYPFSDYGANYRYKHLEHQIKQIHKKELCATAMMPMTIFEVSWQLRGMENLLFDFMENKLFAKYLLDHITEIRRFMIRRFAEAGVDHIHLGDDMGTQRGMLISLEMWREWFKERMRSIILVAKRVNPEVIISYHSDGNIEKIIAELIEIGIEVLNPVQPEVMDPVKLKKEYGDRLAFWGTVGGQTTMPFGTPEEVKKEVKKRIETVGKEGGLLIAPGHMLQPGVPWRNIMAFFEAVEEHGHY
jgi:uroporphyrinogen decarboxylase